MTFRLFDSASRELRDFEPLLPGRVSIYHCGLTVQSAPHLGHIRKEVVFDVLRRWLSRQGLDVTVIANITDIDDKILAKSAEAGVAWWAHAYRFERELHEAYAALGCLPPSYEPRATGHIPEMLELVQTLLERGHAYVAADDSGDVYFDVRSWPGYGELSGQRIDDMEPAGDADPRGKRDPRDFALWKGHKPVEPATASWPSPWGRGRPGWHLECSAMAGKYLGAEFDIHGGGLDLRFPHHENELAQSRAAGRPFARYWMHNGWVTAAGEKMSKSLGTGALVSEVVDRYPARAVRMYLAQPHYRSAIEFADASLAEATASLERIDTFLQRAGGGLGELPEAFVAALNDDLGTPKAFAVIFDTVSEGNAALHRDEPAAAKACAASVRAMLDVFGLGADDPIWASRAARDDRLAGTVDALLTQFIADRAEAKRTKDFATADAIRDRLAAAGIELTDTRDGTSWSLTTDS